MGLRYEVKFETLDKLIADGSLAARSIITFGHCAATETVIDYLAERGFCVSAILDNNEVKYGDTYKTIPIVSPSYIQDFNDDDLIVLIATRFYDQMTAQLQGLGYTGRTEKLIEYNSPVEYSLSKDTIARKTERMLRGREMLSKIREQYPEGHLVVCPLDALGDVYTTMSYLPEHQRKNGIAECVAVVNGNGCRQVAEMFGVSCVSLHDEQMDVLVQAVIYTCERNCILAHHDRIYTDITIKWLNKHKMTFENYYKYAIFGLPATAKQAVPKQLKLFENAVNIPQGKTVIIAPYAKSVVGISNDYWQGQVVKYKDKGYTVCTNISGNEKPLENTMPITFPLNQAVSAVEYAGTFIGIRSGLCDIINMANCDKTVIFLDRYYSSTQMKLVEFWGLADWKQIIV